MNKKVKNPDKLLSYVLSEKWIIIVLIVSGILYNVLRVFVPIYQGRMVDSLLNGDEFSTLVKFAVMFLVMNIIVQFMRFLKRLSNRTFAKRLAQNLREIIYNNIVFMDLKEFSNNKIGNLMTITISDVDVVVNGVRKCLNEVFDTGIMAITYFYTLYLFDAKITLYASAFIPISIVLAYFIRKVIFKYNKIYRDQSSEVTGLIYQIVDNFIPFRIYGTEEINEEMFHDSLDDLQKKAVKKTAISTGISPIYSLVANLGTIPILYLGGLNVISGEWTIGGFTAYFAIALQLFKKSSTVATLFNIFTESKVSWNRIAPFLQTEKTIDRTSTVTYDKTILEVNDLSFAYGLEDNIIENISFSAKNSEIIGVTGEIGSGKSAFLSAFMNVYPYGGSIKIDGKELSEYSEYETSNIFGYLLHDAQLFSESIKENIAFDDEVDIYNVLKDVCFLDDLESMDKGIDTIVGNKGVRLSGGQMARVSTARALARRNGIDRKIIILDDPFSALDMKTEKDIINNLKNNYKNSIIILISHRLEIFDTVDKIILLEKNGKATLGTHKELINDSEIYKELYLLQKGGLK